MPFLIIGAILAILVYIPSYWVRRVMSNNSAEIEGLPGTGSELAQHLINRFQLEGISVEETDPMRDHFDPKDKKVRLSPANFHGKSLTAVAVAAHEVGHAIQFHRKEKIFELRSRYLPTAQALNQAGVAIMWSFPIIGLVLRSPFAVGMVIGLSLLLQLAGAFAYLIILPEEWDASFNKALPILEEGEYVEEKQIPAIRKILKAAALTYFAAALANVLHIGRWFLVLRR
ncbi:MAG: zinc metallopeptidase [Gammaproteobacteria bacterium]|nr:zinc metallopeptidase [Gammaproteobacteria bacterium]MDD9895776.1 zinc metallopeptidase [Gammaproteobacteria bacterium]MDD9959907.1 zinc metallopeptidase [Gammaproteobacteria bacterium]